MTTPTDHAMAAAEVIYNVNAPTGFSVPDEEVDLLSVGEMAAIIQNIAVDRAVKELVQQLSKCMDSLSDMVFYNPDWEMRARVKAVFRSSSAILAKYTRPAPSA